ncbi:Uncharacterised protein [uncultured archaeon]|nr:Uncharacterised protein [uncultured archaeon]
MKTTTAGSISLYFGVAKVLISSSKGFAGPGFSSSMGISSSFTSSSTLAKYTFPPVLSCNFDSISPYFLDGTQPSMMNAFGLVANRRGASAFCVSIERNSSAAIMKSAYSFLILSSSDFRAAYLS